MNPTTPLAVLSAAIRESSKCSPATAAWEACAILDELAAHHWHLAPDVSLPTEAPTRRSGPRTSDAAAESIYDTTERQHAVWNVLGFSGPFTDEELANRYRSWAAADPERYPSQSESSIRTRRKELQRAGHVVDTGETRPTRANRQATVWAARSNESRVAS